MCVIVTHSYTIQTGYNDAFVCAENFEYAHISLFMRRIKFEDRKIFLFTTIIP